MIHNLIVTFSSIASLPHRSTILLIDRRISKQVLKDALIQFDSSFAGPPPRSISMQSHSWGIVQQQQTNCYMPPPKLLPPYMDYNNSYCQNRSKNDTPKAMERQSSSFVPAFNYQSNGNARIAGFNVQEQNTGFNYVYSNSGQKFEYGLHENHHPHQQHRQEFTTTTTAQNITMNR